MVHKKAMMHSIEGVIAALLILSFFTTIDFSVRQIDWADAKTIASTRDLSDMVTGTELKNLVIENRGEDLKKIIKSFISPSSRITIKTYNFPKKDILVGMLMNSSERIEINAGAPGACPVELTANSCAEGSVDGSTNFIALKISADGVFDRMYVDFNNNGTYDSHEGPLGSSNLFFLSGQPYIVHSMKYNGTTVNAVFWNASKVIDYFYNLRDYEINSRKTRIIFSVTDLEETTEYYTKYDALLIPYYRDLSFYESKLSNIQSLGIPLVEIADIPAASDIVQENIFGIETITYNRVSSSDDVSINSEIKAYDMLYPLDKYTLFSGIMLDNFTTDTAGYTNLPSGSLKISNILFKGGNIAIILTDTGIGYNESYFDSNKDLSFAFPDNTSYDIGETIMLDGNNYTIKTINPAGVSMNMLLNENHIFKGTANPTKIYAKSGSSKNVAAQYNNKIYYINITNNIGDLIDTTTDAGFTNPTLLSGIHRNGTLNLGTGYVYSIVATNSTGNYTRFNIDLNHDGNYDDDNEGPFYTTESIFIGPEKYQFFVADDGTKITAKLKERLKVPYIIATKEGTKAKTAWMQAGLEGVDYWTLLQGTLLWASNKEDTVISSYAGDGDVVSIKKTLIINEDFLEFGEIEFLVAQ